MHADGQCVHVRDGPLVVVMYKSNFYQVPSRPWREAGRCSRWCREQLSGRRPEGGAARGRTTALPSGRALAR